jgi:membrane protease YdiL (CAAX protease family)
LGGPRPAAAFALSLLALVSAVVLSSALLGIIHAMGGDLQTDTGDGRIPFGTFAVSALVSAVGLATVSWILLLGFRGPVPLRLSRKDAKPMAVAIAVVWSANFLGTRGIEWFGESYSGFPEIPAGIGPWVVFLLAVVLAPAAEELLFRELLLVRVLRAVPRPVAAAFTSVAFGLMHLGTGGPILVATLTAMGFALAWLRLRTGSLTAPILVHGLNNLLALVLH